MNSVPCFINGKAHQIPSRYCLTSAGAYLREQLGLTGLNISCNEGDCGSCSVLLGTLAGDRIAYRAVNACIIPVWQLVGTHVVTVEALATGDRLTPVQLQMCDHHASQCGACTAGFVVGLHSEIEQRRDCEGGCARTPLTEAEVVQAFDGRICRCTGYKHIVDAAVAVDPSTVEAISAKFPDREFIPEMRRLQDCDVTADPKDGAPATLLCTSRPPRVFDFLFDHPGARIVAGATDVGVELNWRPSDEPPVICDISRLAGFRPIKRLKKKVRFGSLVTIEELAEHCREDFPAFSEMLRERFASGEIRRRATLGGNIANASPTADTLPFLFVMNAKLVLRRWKRQRRLDIRKLYRGYKQLDLKPGELIEAVDVPFLTAGERVFVHKQSARSQQDIAAVTGALRVTLDDNVIVKAAFALGAVGPVVIRLPEVEKLLVDRPFTAAEMRKEAIYDAIQRAIKPIGDSRATEQQRRIAAGNILPLFASTMFAAR